MAFLYGYATGYAGVPDYSAVANAVRPLRRKAGGVYEAAAQFGVPGDSVFMSWMQEALNRGYDVGESRGGKKGPYG